VAHTVDFETKCYENDWAFVLRPGFLEIAVKRCRYAFTKRRLIVNNVSDRNAVAQAGRNAIARGAIDECVFAEDHADPALRAVGLTRDGLANGYVFSISELVGAHLSKSDYLVHFSSDSVMYKGQPDWISPAIALMKDRPEILVTNPTWNRQFSAAVAESSSTFGEFWLGYGFSDQCYLIRAAEFRRPIYDFRHPASERYPAYGGPSFEKRVDSYMRVHGKLRATHQLASYRHKNFPKSGLRRFWRRLTIGP